MDSFYNTSPSSSSNSSGTSSSYKKRSTKMHVPTACVNCKKAHLACDLERPCKRCVSLNRSDSCYDIKHKKRGRPKLSEKRIPAKHQSSIVEMCSITPPPRIQDKKAPPRNIATKAPVAPGLACSSFTMTEQPGHQTPPETEDTRMITIFLTLDLRCIRVSDEAFEMLGLYPQQLTNRSLFDLVDNPQNLAHIYRFLTDHIVDKQVTATFQDFFSLSPYRLSTVANGSLTLKEVLTFKREDGGLSLLDARLYFGGGLGADLFSPDSLSRLYLVCILTKPRTNSNNNTTSYCPVLSPSPTTVTSTCQHQRTSHPSPAVTDDELIWTAATTTSSSEATLSPSSTNKLLFTGVPEPIIPVSSKPTIADDPELVWMQPPDNVTIPVPLSNATALSNNNNLPLSDPNISSTQQQTDYANDPFYLVATSSSSIAAEPRQYCLTSVPFM